jgi:hypothetical protein
MRHRGDVAHGQAQRFEPGPRLATPVRVPHVVRDELDPMQPREGQVVAQPHQRVLRIVQGHDHSSAGREDPGELGEPRVQVAARCEVVERGAGEDSHDAVGPEGNLPEVADDETVASALGGETPTCRPCHRGRIVEAHAARSQRSEDVVP